MVRPPLSPAERARGERLGATLREARGARSMADVAAESGIPVETLRKIETGRIATPAFFTVVALAAALGVDLERVAARCVEAQRFGAQCAAGESPPRAASA
jgi:transcriptional regulator with XRE-family HTH domain